MQVITYSSHPLLPWYVAGWVMFCAVAAAVVFRDREVLHRGWRAYWGYLTVPWKLAVFVPAFLFVSFGGRFTDDETWDVVTGGGMSLLTFFTAPAFVGIVYQVFAGRRPARYLIVAVALLLFSSSWFYDGYLLLRDGRYTSRWWSNLMLSPVIYLAAGFLWNLEARGGVLPSFGFTRPDWPARPADSGFLPIVIGAIPLVLVAGFFLVAFVRWTGGAGF